MVLFPVSPVVAKRKEADLTGSLTAAVVCAAVLGMCFTQTRLIGIGAICALTYFHPWLVGVVLVLVVLLFYLLKLRKK